MRAKVKTSTKALVAALIASAALVAGAAGPAQAGTTVKKHDIGYWSRVDLDTVIFYDWTMRNKYRVDLRDACPAMNASGGARLATTHMGRIDGSFYDRMIFRKGSCYISSVEKLSKDQFAALTDGKVQVAALSR